MGIVLAQGDNVGPSIFGSPADGTVQLSSDNITGVRRWKFELLDAPSGSAYASDYSVLPITLQEGATPTCLFTPETDVDGAYSFQMTTFNEAGTVVEISRGILGVKDPTGRFIPSFNAVAATSRFIKNGIANLRGWATYLEEWIDLLKKPIGGDITSPIGGSALVNRIQGLPVDRLGANAKGVRPGAVMRASVCNINNQQPPQFTQCVTDAIGKTWDGVSTFSTGSMIWALDAVNATIVGIVYEGGPIIRISLPATAPGALIGMVYDGRYFYVLDNGREESMLPKTEKGQWNHVRVHKVDTTPITYEPNIGFEPGTGILGVRGLVQSFNIPHPADTEEGNPGIVPGQATSICQSGTERVLITGGNCIFRLDTRAYGAHQGTFDPEPLDTEEGPSHLLGEIGRNGNFPGILDGFIIATASYDGRIYVYNEDDNEVVISGLFTEEGDDYIPTREASGFRFLFERSGKLFLVDTALTPPSFTTPTLIRASWDDDGHFVVEEEIEFGESGELCWGLTHMSGDGFVYAITNTGFMYVISGLDTTFVASGGVQVARSFELNLFSSFNNGGEKGQILTSDTGPFFPGAFLLDAERGSIKRITGDGSDYEGGWAIFSEEKRFIAPFLAFGPPPIGPVAPVVVSAGSHTVDSSCGLTIIDTGDETPVILPGFQEDGAKHTIFVMSGTAQVYGAASNGTLAQVNEVETTYDIEGPYVGKTFVYARALNKWLAY